ncbi:MAG: hypothetical protein Q7R96_01765 [Nanoarchaeota archaeon]|nr:hypothetical protein [Nanoarchaeota archaeon]
MAYQSNNLYHVISPSPERVAFQQQFKFPVRAREADWEQSPENRRIITEVLHTEMREHPFDLTFFEIAPAAYWKKGFSEQIGEVFCEGYNGVAIAKLNAIVVNPSGIKNDTLHHEVKHIKTFQVLKDHPEFKGRWEALCKDDHGNSRLQFTNMAHWSCSRIKGLSQLVDEKPTPEQEECRRQGFVSRYAATNFFEDVAELCAEAELTPFTFEDAFDGGKRSSKVLIDKLCLAEEYRLVPAGYRDYLVLGQAVIGCWTGDMYGSNLDDREKCEKYLEKSADFLKKYPNSRFAGKILWHRASILVARKDKNYYLCDTDIFAPAKSIVAVREALAELKTIECLPERDGWREANLYQQLGNGYRKLGDEKKAEEYYKKHTALVFPPGFRGR